MFAALAVFAAGLGITRITAQTRVTDSSPATLSHAPETEHDGFAGDLACRQCHLDKFDSYQASAHHRTSRLPDENSIAGRFTTGRNRLKTLNPELSFRMDSSDGRFFESALLHKRGQTNEQREPIDLVIGSATKGQTYLYWKRDGLLELPVSYWAELDQWVNSPGYVDGSADFERPVTPRCMECHATYFQPISPLPSENHYNKDNFILGISCERCHGPGKEHLEFHRANANSPGTAKPLPPVKSTRDRQIDVCAQCHGGVGKSIAPAFTFEPGDQLSKFITLQEPNATDRLDVHGNQVALLERSRCFRESPNMSCSTCHDVHAREQAAPSYSSRCLECHQVSRCGMFRKLGTQISSNCIDCHMPVQASSLLVLDANDARLSAKVRTHWIRVYRDYPKP